VRASIIIILLLLFRLLRVRVVGITIMTGGGLIWVNEAYVLARVILIVTYLYLVLSLSLSLCPSPHPLPPSHHLCLFACLLADLSGAYRKRRSETHRFAISLLSVRFVVITTYQLPTSVSVSLSLSLFVYDTH
jgi:hypothetical protein